MHKIRDWLYISDYPTAQSARFLAKHGIEAALLLYKPVENDNIEMLFMPVEDAKPLKRADIEAAIEFIHEQHEQGHCLLVSCGSGISRSSTFALIALKEIEGLSMRDAYLSIYREHSRAMPDHQQWQSVSDFYDEPSNFWEVWQYVIAQD